MLFQSDRLRPSNQNYKSLKKLAMNKHYSLFLVIVIMVDVTYGIAKYARVIVPDKAF